MIDLLIVISFVVYSISMGFIHRKKASESIDEYFLAGRTLPGWKAGVSMAATQYSADTPLLVAGLVATAGIFSLWRLWIYAVAFLFMGIVLGSCWRRAMVLTDAELTEVRYSNRAVPLLRCFKAIHLGTFINCTVLAMVLTAAARVAEPFLLWNEWLPTTLFDPLSHAVEYLGFRLTSATAQPELWILSTNNFISLSLIVAFTWLYSTTGGLRSVVATDIVQFGIMMGGTLLYAGYVFFEVGFGEFSAKLSGLYGTDAAEKVLSFGPQELSSATMLFISVLGIQWLAQVNADGSGYLAQRMMACRDERESKKAAIIFTFAQVLLRSLLWLPIIIGLLIIYPANPALLLSDSDETFRVSREALFAQGIRDLLPVGIRGLMLTGMLAALASTVDTHLNWGASYWTNDLYKRFFAPLVLRREVSGRELVWVARASNVGILVISLFIAVKLSSIQSAWQMNLMLGSGLGLVLVLRWLWYRINLYSEFAAIGVSLVLAPVLLLGFPELDDSLRLLIVFAVSTVAVIVATLATPPEPDATLRTFYQRVQPPGWWGPVAVAVGEERGAPFRRFYRGIIGTLFASFVLFALLFGIGSWLVR